MLYHSLYKGAGAPPFTGTSGPIKLSFISNDGTVAISPAQLFSNLVLLRLLRTSIVPAAASIPAPRTDPMTENRIVLYQPAAASPHLLALAAAGCRPAGHMMQAEALPAPVVGW
jgi:hypothetical protein